MDTCFHRNLLRSFAVLTTKDENAVSGITDIQDTVRGEPFDKLRANGLDHIFKAMT